MTKIANNLNQLIRSGSQSEPDRRWFFGEIANQANNAEAVFISSLLRDGARIESMHLHVNVAPGGALAGFKVLVALTARKSATFAEILNEEQIIEFTQDKGTGGWFPIDDDFDIHFQIFKTVLGSEKRIAIAVENKSGRIVSWRIGIFHTV